MRNRFFMRLSASAMALITTLSMLPAIPASARNLEWETIGGKDYWYENDVKMGVYGAPGNVWYDGTERGKEIYDPGSGAWYWLDACYDGAKATGKEVFMPYIYGNEKELDYIAKYNLAYESNTCEENLENAKLGYQIWQVMVTGTGKWVRYDEYGRMIKGWVTIEGDLAKCYPDQEGNVYYYDRRTGIMAKGIVEIDGKHYEFDRITGVLIGETDKPTDEEEYELGNTTYPEESFVCVSIERIYQNPEEGYANEKTVYKYEDPDDPTNLTSSETFTEYNGEYLKTGESAYISITCSDGQDSYSDSVETSSKRWSIDADTNQLYLSQETEYRYDENLGSSEVTYELETCYDPDGNKIGIYEYTYEYDANGNCINSVISNTDFDASGNVIDSYSYGYIYTYENGRLVEDKSIRFEGYNDDSIVGVSDKTEYFYDENGNRIREEYSYNTIIDVDGKDEYSGDFVLSEVKYFTYEKIGDDWYDILEETYDVIDGVVSDQIIDRIVNRYDDYGYSAYYRGYVTDSEYDYEKDEYVYSDLYLSCGSDYENQYIPDSIYPFGYRGILAKETEYIDADKDGNEEVYRYTLYESDYLLCVKGLEVGQTETITNITYNADNTEYCREINTYEGRA